MLRDEDEFDQGIDCPVCHRTFSTYARLEDTSPSMKACPSAACVAR